MFAMKEEKEMYYEPLTEKHSLPWDPFKSCTVPRAIGWISTKNEDGTDNIAPYSHFTNLTFDPPTVLISATQNIFGERKTTVRNIERTGEFIFNMVSYDLREEMNRSSIVEVRRVLQISLITQVLRKPRQTPWM